MKIISRESPNSDVDFSLKKDLLIPCFMYKVPIETSKNKDLNFIEKTILKLIQVDDSLKNDTIRLSKMLGFYSEKKPEDKTKIISLILTKIKDLRIDEMEDEDNSEVTIYHFYQEAYTNELLPIITKDINDFSYVEKDKFKDKIYKEISFKKEIHSKSLTNAILANGYKQNNPPKPTKSDIIKTIYKHNQNKYKGSHTIDYKNFNIEIFESELIFLHTKFYIPKNNIQSFVITNGFTNDFSTVLRKVFEYKHQELLKFLRQETKSDVDKMNNNNVNIPFEDKINRYSDIKELMKTIEKEGIKIQQDEITKDAVKRSKDMLIQSLYDLVEKSFAIFSDELHADKTLQDKKLLKTLAKDFGFYIDIEKHLSIFNVDSRDNLQKYLARTLIYKKNELYELVSLFPELFFSLNSLLELRNGVKHSDKENTLEKVNKEDLIKYKNLIYKIISIILKVKQKVITQDEIDNDDDNTYTQNAYIALEEEVNMDAMNKLPDEVKDNLTSINFYLNSVDFDTNRFNVVKEVINNLYSSFEFIVKQIINTLVINEQNIATKDEILEKIREKIEVGESLYRVSPKMVELAFQKQGASLGAYMLVYLYSQKTINPSDVILAENIIALRGHGSPSIEDVGKITLQELKALKQNSFKYIEKLMEEV